MLLSVPPVRHAKTSQSGTSSRRSGRCSTEAVHSGTVGTFPRLFLGSLAQKQLFLSMCRDTIAETIGTSQSRVVGGCGEQVDLAVRTLEASVLIDCEHSASIAETILGSAIRDPNLVVRGLFRPSTGFNRSLAIFLIPLELCLRQRTLHDYLC